MNALASKGLIVVAMASLLCGAAWADRGGDRVRGRVDVHVGAPMYQAHYGGHYGGHYRGHYGHSHSGARVFIGPGAFYDPFWYPYRAPYYWGPGGYGYYPPPVVAVPSSPPVYIEQPAPAASNDYWYWCADPQGYYPNVKTCPGGWQAVAPQ